MHGDSGAEGPKASTLIGHFIGHVLYGAFGFLVLAIPAVLFSIAAHYVGELPVSPMVIYVLIGGHYFLFAIDVAYFGSYIMISFYGAAKELIRYAKGL